MWVDNTRALQKSHGNKRGSGEEALEDVGEVGSPRNDLSIHAIFHGIFMALTKKKKP